MITTIKEFKKVNEAYISAFCITEILSRLNIDKNECTKIGEGDNGVAFKYNDKCIKITSDAEEAEFFATIKGAKLNHVVNVYEIYEYDSEFGENNKNDRKFNNSRYYWVIIKEYLPYKYNDSNYYNMLRYFDIYQEENSFDYSEKAFNKMIDEYRKEHIEYMSDDEDYDIDEDYDFQTECEILELFKNLHLELQPFGIKSVSDMKSTNMGVTSDGDIKYLELHIYKIMNNYKEPIYTQLEKIKNNI